jgi:hypothetical protein
MKNDHASEQVRTLRLPACILVALLAGCGEVNSALAASLTITSCADDGSDGTLRTVVSEAASGDTLDLTQLTCGTITLLTGQIEVHVDNLTINGPGQETLTIDGNYNGRVLLDDGKGTLTLNGLTIAHGLADSAANNPSRLRGAYGGCILSDSYSAYYGDTQYGSVTLTDATVTGCEAISHSNKQAMGGGIHAAAAVTLNNSTVSNNQAIGLSIVCGGGVFARYGVVAATNSLITGNRASTNTQLGGGITQATGGGLCSYNKGVVVSGTTITNNFAGCDSTSESCYSAAGGGIRAIAGPGSVITLSSSIVANNIIETTSNQNSTAYGAGVYAEAVNSTAQNIVITNSTISGNIARNPSLFTRGGGLKIFSNDSGAYIFGSTIDNNSAGYGGGVSVEVGSLTLVNSTVSSNTASELGGGIYVSRYEAGVFGTPPMKIVNSTIASNVSTGSKGGAGVVDNHNVMDGFTELQSSIIANNSNTTSNATYYADLSSGGSNATLTGSNNLITAASGVALPSDTLSVNPMLGPLQDNGGPTWTHALLAGSPAIDAGNNSANLAFDQRGLPFARVSGPSADIGAFEYQSGFAVPTLTAYFTPNTFAAGSGVSYLTITLGNGGNSSLATLSAALTDTLPTSIYIASPANAATNCPNGTVTAESGSGVITLDAGAQIPAAGSCTVTVSVTANSEGSYSNIIPANALQTNLGANDEPAQADLTVTPPADRIFANSFEGS